MKRKGLFFIMKELFRRTANIKRWIVFCIITALISVFLDILVTYFLYSLITLALESQVDKMFPIAFMMLGSVVLGIFVRYFARYASLKISINMSHDLNKQAFDHIKNIDYSTLIKEKSGSIVSKITNTTTLIEQFFQAHFFNLIYYPLLIVSVTVYMLILSWPLLLVSSVLMWISFFLISFLSKPIRVYMKKLHKSLDKANNIVNDTINGMAVLKAFNLEDFLFKKYNSHIDDVYAKAQQENIRSSLLRPFQVIIRLSPFVICIAFGGYLVIQKIMTVGALIAFITLLNYMVTPANLVALIIRDVFRMRGAFEHLFKIFKLPIENKRQQNSITAANVENIIEFKDVTFSYDGQSKVLNKMNFTIKKGDVVGLVGPSGSGKTTIYNLLCGFYQNYEGEISVLGHELSEWNLEELRKQISVVDQSIYLFPLSIQQNISFGEPGSTEKQIVSVAKTAFADEFISELPDGYETVIKEQNVKLSGGQAQRIALARALLKNSPICLLDEYASSLDSHAEKMIQKSIRSAFNGKTILIAAHRLSTIKYTDKVLVIKDGKIVESGSHEELIDRSLFYKELFSGQYSEAISVK